MNTVIAGLHSYPIKSCGAFDYSDSCELSSAGLPFDREWVLVDDRGTFMTQRKWPRMALISPQPTLSGLWLRAPDQEDLFLSTQTSTAQDIQVSVNIWSSACLGRDEGEVAARWLSTFLGVSCRLLRRHTYGVRHPDPDLLHRWQSRHRRIDAEHNFGFADSLPFLFTNEASLTQLNQHVLAEGDAAVEMARFRPNIVLSGLPAYAEDQLRGLYVGEQYFAVLKPCTRCPLPNVNQATAQVGRQPLRALMTTRRFGSQMHFGVQAVLASPARARLTLGDSVRPDFA